MCWQKVTDCCPIWLSPKTLHCWLQNLQLASLLYIYRQEHQRLGRFCLCRLQNRSKKNTVTLCPHMSAMCAFFWPLFAKHGCFRIVSHVCHICTINTVNSGAWTQSAKNANTWTGSIYYSRTFGRVDIIVLGPILAIRLAREPPPVPKRTCFIFSATHSELKISQDAHVEMRLKHK